MAISTSNISLQAIQAAVGHSGTSNISLQAQSQNASNTSHTSTRSGYTSPGGGLTGSPYGMGEFAGYVDLSIGSFPNLGQGYTSSAMTGSTVSTNFNARRSHFSNQSGIQCGAFAVWGFRHTPSNGYVTIEYYSGTNAAYAPVYYQKLAYTGLSNATWSVKYEYPGITTNIATFANSNGEARIPSTTNGGNRSEGTYYQLSASGTGNTYFMQFPYIAIANAQYGNQQDNGQARIGDAVLFNANNYVQFTLKANQGGVDYTTTSTSYPIELTAQRGALVP